MQTDSLVLAEMQIKNQESSQTHSCVHPITSTKKMLDAKQARRSQLHHPRKKVPLEVHTPPGESGWLDISRREDIDF